jgi:hypothetical protein
MADQSIEKIVLGGKALELVMRDVLCGMEDLATRLGYDVTPYRVEILSIDPAPALTGGDAGHASAVILAFPQRETAVARHALRKKIS